MRLIVVYNPKAGDQGWPKGAIEERLGAAGHEVELVSSKGEWQTCLDAPTDAFVAAGGDGTVGKLALALAGSDRPLAILPLGTANNLARAFGYAPGSDPFARVPHWGEDESSLRVGCAQSGGGTRPFLEVAGAGAFARRMSRKDGKKRPVPLDSVIIARRGLMDEIVEGPLLEAEIELDGRSASGRFVMLACLRTPSFGPALRLAPEQRPDHPALTVIGVRNHQRERFAWWLVTGEGHPAEYRIGSAARIALTVAGPVHVDDKLLDGEPEEPRPVTVASGEKAVRVYV